MNKKISIHTQHRKRVFENFLRAGCLDGFSDVQIIEMILFYVIPIKDTNLMAHNVIDIFGTAEDVFNAPPLEIVKRTKYSLKTACVLSVVSKFYEIASRMCKMTNTSEIHIISERTPFLLEKYAQENSLCSFDDVEILEMFLYYCVGRSTTNEIAYNLLDEFVLLREVFRAAPNEIIDKLGYSLRTACFLAAPAEISKRFSIKNSSYKAVRFNSVEKIAAYLMPYLKDRTEEYFYVMCLDENMAEQRTICLSKGSTNFADVKINELMEKVLVNKASYVLIAHNHPSGDVRASAEDINLTAVVSVAMKSIRVKLLDHIIIGKNSYFSFAQNNLFADSFKKSSR